MYTRMYAEEATAWFASTNDKMSIKIKHQTFLVKSKITKKSFFSHKQILTQKNKVIFTICRLLQNTKILLSGKNMCKVVFILIYFYIRVNNSIYIKLMLCKKNYIAHEPWTNKWMTLICVTYSFLSKTFFSNDYEVYFFGYAHALFSFSDRLFLTYIFVQIQIWNVLIFIKFLYIFWLFCWFNLLAYL